jgi:hypothetical protein
MITKENNMTLTAFSLKDANGFSIASQTSEPLNITIGDKLRLELSYTTSFGVGETLNELWANFGLFIKPNCIVPPNKPQYGFSYFVNSGTTTGIDYEMCFTGDPTEQNQAAFVKFNTVSLDNFTLSLNFVASTDTNAFIQGLSLSNSFRLLSGLENGLFLSNDANSVYSTLKAIGVLAWGESDNESVYSSAAINADGTFLQESALTGEEITYERNGQPVTNVSSINDTIITPKATYTAGTISQARLWVVKSNSIQGNRPFYLDFTQDYLLPVPTSPAANEYESNYTLQASEVNDGDVFYFVAVFYDETNDFVGSFFEGPVFTSDTQSEQLLVLDDIESSLRNYNFSGGDYIDSPPLLRIQSVITIDKTGYNSKAYSGDWGSNFSRAEIRIVFGGNDVAISDFSSDSVEILSDSPTELSYIYTLRISEDWIGETIDIEHEYFFVMNGQSDSYVKTQKIDVLDYDENRIDAAILTLNVTNETGDIILDVCNDPTQDIKTLATSDTEDYNHIVSIDSSEGLIESEKYVSPIGMEQFDPLEVPSNDVDYVGNDASSTIHLENNLPPLDYIVVHALPYSHPCAILTEDGYPIISEDGFVLITEDCA